MKVKSVNCPRISRAGTTYQGELLASYSQIVSKIGEPEIIKDGYKADAEWLIKFVEDSGPNPREVTATIYNWKNGINYCGAKGLPVKDIKEWHIGGDCKEAVELVIDHILHSWPVFDKIRMAAKYETAN